jgi:hypothetical protein
VSEGLPKKIPAQLVGGARKVVNLYHPRTLREKGALWAAGLLTTTYVIVNLLLSTWWSLEPDSFEVRAHAADTASREGQQVVVGYTTTATLMRVAATLLDKAGGYLSNDVAPPGVFLDNMPNWEFGVLVQVRDLARSLRNDMSRSQSQSVEDADLAFAEPQFNVHNDSWMFPATETEYRKGIDGLGRYLNRLAQRDRPDTQFYARADNLRDWLAITEKRLGSLSQRLSASVGQVRVNTDLAGDTAAAQSTAMPDEVIVKTPWVDIDDVFWEARGTTWALIHFLHAIEIDFSEVLNKKAASPSLRQIIRELEATQSTVWSPMVLNGGGFGIVTNYSLIMANYISRANAAIIDLRSLLQQG